MPLLWGLLGLAFGGLLNGVADGFTRRDGVQQRQVRTPFFWRPGWWLLMDSLRRNSGSSVGTPSADKRDLWIGVGGELALGLAFGYVSSLGRPLSESAILVAACVYLVLVALVDLKHRLVPNALVLPACVLVLLWHCLCGGCGIPEALLGCAVGMSPFMIAAWLRPGTVGGGDVKLAGLIGLVAGFPHVLWPVCLAIVAGAGTSIALLATHRATIASRMAYAPFLCAGALVTLFWHPWILLFTG
ncbi:MAG: prepilin peptidase [Anaerolineae bacterium]